VNFGDCSASRLADNISSVRDCVCSLILTRHQTSELELDMAFELLPYLLLLPLLAIPLGSFTLSRAKHTRQQLRLPPGPRALPVIGHLHHFAGAPPHHALRDLARRHGPLMMLRFCELPVMVASSLDVRHVIQKTHDVNFASRPVGPMLQLVFRRGAQGVIFAPYGEGWRQLRKICARCVHALLPPHP
jgi:hypothetical protein